MAVNQWRAVLTDMTYKPLCELQNVYERTLNIALNRTDTAGIKVRVDHEYAELIYSLDCYLKLYRNNTLVHFGLLQNSEETVDDQGAYVTATSAGPSWVLPKRFPVRQANAISVTGARSRIAQQLIASVNIQNPEFGPGVDPVLFEKVQGETGIGWNVGQVFTAGGTITYSVPPFKPMSEILAELADASDGFDWRIRPWENWVDGALTHPSDQGYKTGKLEVGAPIGTAKPAAIFEFGAGRQNVKQYTRVKSRDTQANGIYHLLNGQPEDNSAYSYINPTYEADYGAGVIEDLVQADLTQLSLRNALCAEHINTRYLPRDIVQWTPMGDYGDGRLPEFGVDYDIGDFVTGRAKYGASTRFNGQFRVWGVDFTIDNAGVETPKIMLEYQN